jgi:hypothetical protein
VTRWVSVRLDAASALALAFLTRDGASVSSVVRTAILDAAAAKISEVRPSRAEREQRTERAVRLLTDLRTLDNW